MAMLIHEELSRSIIGAAMKVLNELKPGLDEKLYERALVLELLARGHQVESQKQFEVLYRGQSIGWLVPDMIVDGLVIVDPKVAAGFHETHIAQMLGYLAITRLDLALLLNFKYAKLQWKRVVKERVSSEEEATADYADNTDESRPIHPF
jgi:GxxExxY protein